MNLGIFLYELGDGDLTISLNLGPDGLDKVIIANLPSLILAPLVLPIPTVFQLLYNQIDLASRQALTWVSCLTNFFYFFVTLTSSGKANNKIMHF